MEWNGIGAFVYGQLCLSMKWKHSTSRFTHAGRTHFSFAFIRPWNLLPPERNILSHVFIGLSSATVLHMITITIAWFGRQFSFKASQREYIHKNTNAPNPIHGSFWKGNNFAISMLRKDTEMTETQVEKTVDETLEELNLYISIEHLSSGYSGLSILPEKKQCMYSCVCILFMHDVALVCVSETAIASIPNACHLNIVYFFCRPLNRIQTVSDS